MTSDEDDKAKGLKLDHAVIEFKALKKIVANRYHHLSPVAMWKSVMSKYYSTHPNMFLIIELILCLMWASSVCRERIQCCYKIICALPPFTRYKYRKRSVDAPYQYTRAEKT